MRVGMVRLAPYGRGACCVDATAVPNPTFHSL